MVPPPAVSQALHLLSFPPLPSVVTPQVEKEKEDGTEFHFLTCADDGDGGGGDGDDDGGDYDAAAFSTPLLSSSSSTWSLLIVLVKANAKLQLASPSFHLKDRKKERKKKEEELSRGTAGRGSH